jgi:hypothetical protein
MPHDIAAPSMSQFIIYSSDKKPRSPFTGQVCNPHDPQMWTDYQTASNAVAAGLGKGVGMVFTSNDPFVFIDLDHALQSDGTWSEEATKICQAFAGAYIEVSSSGTGLHIICSGNVPDNHSTRNGTYGIELYHTLRYCALTGYHATGSMSHPAQAQLDWLLSRSGWSGTSQATAGQLAEWTTTPVAEWNGPTDDDELIKRMLSSRPNAASIFGNRASLIDLWNANSGALAKAFPDTRGYDCSRADAALCSHLAFWTGKDCERMDRLFRQSDLYREKWERLNYKQTTILKAVALCRDVLGDRQQPVNSLETPGDQWQEPLPLPEGLPPVKTLEPDMIPEPLRGWLMDIADRMQIPPDFSTAAAVVALGSIIGRGCGIHPKRHDDWLVVPNLWGAVVGRPSLMKTPAVSEAQKHLCRLETEARDDYKKAAAAFEIDKEVLKLTKTTIGEEIKKALKQGKDIEEARGKLAALQDDEPIRRRYQTQDGTTEKIGELLNQNSRGLLVNRDELIGWFRSLDRDGRDGDRAFYLEAWNGNCGYTYDRIGRGTLDISALCASVFGAITPGPLSSYVYQANRGGNGDDGLLQRFQVFVWPDASNDWRNVDRFPNTVEKNRAWEIFKALSGEIPGAVKENGADIPALRFSPQGQDVFDSWRHELETRLRSDHGLPPSLESHLTKYRKLMPSLALIFHLVAVADGSTAAGPVSEQAAQMAVAWCQYLESHAGRVYGGATMPGMESAREIVKHIMRGAIQDGATFRDVYRNQWTRLATPEEVRAGMEVLQEYDLLTLDEITTGGRPSKIVRLNPVIKV